MQRNRLAVALLLLCSAACSAQAGLIVSSAKATASTNAFAPLDRSMYFDERTVENVADVNLNAFGDWTGTNYGGSTNTWHWVGSAQTIVTADAKPDSLAIVGAGTFAFDITTASDFGSPNTVALLYGPGAGADYVCAFSIDTPGTYSLSGDVVGATLIQLYSVGQQANLFNLRRNSTSPMFAFSSTGYLPIGDYAIGMNASFGGNVNQGASHSIKSGSFTNFLFTVQTPEPASMAGVPFGAALLHRRRTSLRRNGCI